MSYCDLGKTYWRLGNHKTAINFYERGLKIVKEVGDRAAEGTVYGNLGIAYQSLGDLKRAIDCHRRHLKISKEVSDRTGEGRAYCNLGIAYKSQGDFKTAIDFHERHLIIAKEVGDKTGEGWAYGNLGNAYQGLGDFTTAIDYHKRDLKIAKELGDKAGEGSAYCNLGNAHHSLGDFKTAITFYESDLEIAKEVGDKAGQGRTYGNIAIAYRSLLDLKSAIHYDKLHLKVAKEEGDKVSEGRAYSNLGNTYDNLGDFITAIDYHKRHLQHVKEVGDKAEEGAAYGNLGNAYRGLGDFKTAIDYHECQLKISKEVGDKAGEGLGYGSLGKCFELQGSLSKALDCFNSSVRMFNITWNDLKGKDKWKIDYRNMYEFAYTGRWRVLLKQGKVVEALCAAEQGPAQALNDLMEFNYGFQATFHQLHAQDESMYDSFSFLPSIAVFIAIDEREIVFWVVQDGKNVELRKKKLRDKSFLVLLTVTASLEIGVKRDLKCEDRSLDKLGDKKVANERSPETPTEPVPVQTNALRTFYDIIIDPIADLIRGNELVLVPVGPLFLAPFAAFVDSNSRYLCEVCRIRVIPSLTSLKMITASPDDYHSNTGLLLVGDPWVQEVVCQGKALMEQLPFARKEVQMIGRIFSTKPLTGREATKDEVLRRLPSVALVHIAAHGRMETGEIALAPNTARASQIPAKEDFLLSMKDVMSVQIRARLVVLSCCHSGLGEIKAEGVVGIARAFLGAGARAVLVSLWAIDDDATLEFMRMFYSHLAKGKSASESLNKAMKGMRESDKFNEVKHWAPFVLIGDDVTLEFGGSE